MNNEELERRVRILEESNALLQTQVAWLLARQPLELDCGKLPTVMSHLECQIFHTSPDLIPSAQRRVKTEWSLKLTVWINGRKAKPNIDVALFSGNTFWNQVMARSDKDATIEAFANRVREADYVHAGMLRAVVPKGGRPYVPSQFCVLTGHLIDKPTLMVLVDGRDFTFTSFIPGRGVKSNRAKWYSKLDF